MKQEKNSHEQKPERKAYVPPHLTVYGSLADLTKEGGSGGLDAGLASGGE